MLVGVLAISARIAFHPHSWVAAMLPTTDRARFNDRHGRDVAVVSSRESEQSFEARRIAAAVTETVRREERLGITGNRVAAPRSHPGEAETYAGRGSEMGPNDMLGGSYRRTSRRVSATGQRRDRAS